MPQNVDTLHTMFEAFNRRDFDAALRYLHPDVELQPALTELDVHRLYRGRGEFRQFLETITGPWERYVVEATETFELPGNRVLVVERWRARGRQGIEFDFELTDLYKFTDGLVVRVNGFRDKAEALESAGVSEDPRAGTSLP